MDNKNFKPSWWVIVREKKKYIGCENNCGHLREENGKIKCCYFDKDIKGEEDNYQPCQECFKVFCETKFDVLNMFSYDNKNHFESQK